MADLPERCGTLQSIRPPVKDARSAKGLGPNPLLEPRADSASLSFLMQRRTHLFRRFFLTSGALVLLGAPLPAKATEELEAHIAAIRAVGPEGTGNPAAAAALKKISGSPAETIVPLLLAIEESSPLARNWLRSGVEVIVARELEAGNSLPVEDLKAFVLDTGQAPEARRLAYDLMARIDEPSAGKLIPGFLNDPSTELRRDAVAQLIARGQAQAEEGDKPAASATYRKALDAARDVDQIQAIAKTLTKDFGQELDLPRHFGFLTRWHVIGPFDNTKRAGFEAVFPPEEGVDLGATHAGKDGKEVKWQLLESSDQYGKVDLNKPLEKLKEVTGYAYTEFHSAEARPAELRLGCKNAWKVWLNGELLFGRDEYHRGQRIDQYKMPVQLKKGKNAILVKLCQNEQKEKWTVEWEFQLRVCDSTGTAILSQARAH